MFGRNPRTEDISRWADKNRYAFDAETEGFFTEDALELDGFRNWDTARNHASGTYLNHPFELLDFTSLSKSSEGSSPQEQTVLLMPNATRDLPDFEIMPRAGGSIFGQEALGLGGLSLTTSDYAPGETSRLVREFNKQYHLYEGGLLESAARATGSQESTPLDITPVMPICKQGVLRLLSQNKGWFIESQNGHLALWTQGRVLSTDARSELLALADKLLEQLHQAVREPPMSGLSIQNTIVPRRIIGIFVGFACGFFAGGLVAAGLSLINPKFMLLIPVLALGGAGIGGFLARKFVR